MATIKKALFETGHATAETDTVEVEIRTVRYSKDDATYGLPVLDLIIFPTGKTPLVHTGTLPEVWKRLCDWWRHEGSGDNPDDLYWWAIEPRGEVTFKTT